MLLTPHLIAPQVCRFCTGSIYGAAYMLRRMLGFPSYSVLSMTLRSADATFALNQYL